MCAICRRVSSQQCIHRLATLLAVGLPRLVRSPSCSVSVPSSMQAQGTGLSVLIPGASPWTMWAPRGLGHLSRV